MKIELNNKTQKSFKKMPSHIQKKFKNFMKDIAQTSSLNQLYQKWHVEKMMYDNTIYRAKLDYSYRVGMIYQNNKVEIIQLASRENFTYIGQS